MKEIVEQIEIAENAGVFIYPTIIIKENRETPEEIVFITSLYNDGFISNPERRASESLGETNSTREINDHLKGGEI